MSKQPSPLPRAEFPHPERLAWIARLNAAVGSPSSQRVTVRTADLRALMGEHIALCVNDGAGPIRADVYAKVQDRSDLLAGEITRLRKALEQVEWLPDDKRGHLGRDYCPCCDNCKDTGKHTETCVIGAGLGEEIPR